MKNIRAILAAGLAAAACGAAACGSLKLTPAEAPVITLPLTAQSTLWGLGPVLPPIVPGPKGLILLATKTGTLQAFDPANTEKKSFIWKYYLNQTETPPVVSEGRIIWASLDKRIVRLDEVGKAVWTKTLAEPVRGEMGIVGAAVVFREGEKALSAIDPEKGDILWRTEEVAVADWQADQNRIILRSADNRLKILNPDGKVARDYPLDETAVGLFGLDKDRLFTGLAGGRFGCFDLGRGKMRWSTRVGSETIGRAVSDGRQVYVVLSGQILAAFNARHGDLLWWQPLSGRGAFTPRIIGDYVFVSSLSDKVQAFSRKTGKVDIAIIASRELAAPVETAGTMLYATYNYLLENYVILKSFFMIPPAPAETAPVK